jgi:hypothetical protein
MFALLLKPSKLAWWALRLDAAARFHLYDDSDPAIAARAAACSRARFDHQVVADYKDAARLPGDVARNQLFRKTAPAP